MKSGVLVLECLDEADPGSEGQFLLHMFNLMKKSAQYVEVRTKRQLLCLLDKPPFRLVHITTHGSFDEDSGRKPTFRGLWSPTDDLTLADLSKLKGALSGRAVITTACMSGSRTFARQFVALTGCLHFVAPKKSPSYATAIYFAHLLYHKYFMLADRYRHDIPKIVNDFIDRYKNVAQFGVTSGRP